MTAERPAGRLHKQDIMLLGLDMMDAALRHTDPAEALQELQGVASEFDADTARRVACMLAFECMRTVRPRRSRREMKEWIERRRFTAITFELRSGDV